MLLVFLSDPPTREQAQRWVRLSSRGEVLARGESMPTQWPDDAELVVVLAASKTRLIALDMPPMSRDRLEHAVRLAVDDLVASDADDTVVAIGEPANGKVLAAVASRALVTAIANALPHWPRIVPEAALAPVADDAWTWYRSAGGDAFVRRADGSAFTVGEATDGHLPAELAVAVTQSAGRPEAPRSIRCAFASDATKRAQWSRQSNVPLMPAAPWRWDEATVAALARVPDLARRQTSATSRSRAGWRAFRPALMLAAAALVVHLGGLAATRASLALENRRLTNALVDEASALRLTDATTPAAAAVAIARQHAALRHAAGKSAPADAIPLLARAAPALATLPPGTLRTARYGGDAWTLELGPIDREVVSRVSHALAAAGLDALAAPVSGGTRMRIALAPTAR